MSWRFPADVSSRSAYQCVATQSVELTHCGVGSDRSCIPGDGHEGPLPSLGNPYHLCNREGTETSPTHISFANWYNVFVRPTQTRLDIKKEQLPIRNIRFHPATSSLFSRFTKSYSLDLQTQRQILDDFTKAFPSALCIQLADYVEWRRDSDSAWTWRPFVISRDRARSRLLLMAQSLEVGYLQDLLWTKAVDEDGCLAGLFRPSEMTKSLSLILSSDGNTTSRELQTRLANSVSPRLVGSEVERSDS